MSLALTAAGPGGSCSAPHVSSFALPGRGWRGARLSGRSPTVAGIGSGGGAGRCEGRHEGRVGCRSVGGRPGEARSLPVRSVGSGEAHGARCDPSGRPAAARRHTAVRSPVTSAAARSGSGWSAGQRISEVFLGGQQLREEDINEWKFPFLGRGISQD